MSSLDRETVAKYVLTISAKDKGRPSLEKRCNLTVIVLDVNDNAPSFVQNQYSDSRSRIGSNQESGNFASFSPYTAYHPGRYFTTISEDISPESSVMQIKALDPDQGDNGKVTYAIAEETTWLFKIDNLTGVISTSG